MAQLRMLQRHLSGENEVSEVDELAKNALGVLNFPKFLKTVGMGTYEDLLELAQVLKVPYGQLLSCDLIEQPAQLNIREYVNNGKINHKCLQFMIAQHGDAGSKNWPPRDENPEDHRDQCG